MDKTSQFTHNVADKKFIAEMSDLQGFESHIGPNCLGLRLQSDKTGNISEWGVTGKKVVDGELQWWDLVPTQGTLNKYPKLAGYTMIIFND